MVVGEQYMLGVNQLDRVATAWMAECGPIVWGTC